jgi:hypothetical protein
MLRFVLVTTLAVLSGCGRAGTYLIEAADEPHGKPVLGSERVFIAPFDDSRTNRDLYRGRSEWEIVYVDVAGRTALAKAWADLKIGDLSYLWHRQLAYELGDQGYCATAAAIPLTQSQALEQAKQGEDSLVMEGEIEKLYIDKHGADAFLGTNFSGSNYNFKSQARVRVKEVSTGKIRLNKAMVYEHTFYKNEMLGSDDHDTFPAYFATGLINATRALGEDSDLRKAVGVPTCTLTPTATVTPEIKQPEPGVRPAVTPTPVPVGPYWVNPNNGKRMDPNWRFDPEDGTPRSKFILRNDSK